MQEVIFQRRHLHSDPLAGEGKIRVNVRVPVQTCVCNLSVTRLFSSLFVFTHRSFSSALTRSPLCMIKQYVLLLLHTSSTIGVGDLSTLPPTAYTHSFSSRPASLPAASESAPSYRRTQTQYIAQYRFWYHCTESVTSETSCSL